MTARRLLASAVSLAALMTSCSDGAQRSTAPGQRPDSIRLLAAASLTEALTQIQQSFLADNPGSELEFSFGGSSSLVQQLAAGAPADVLITADIVTMGAAREGGEVGEAQMLARNRLTMVVEPGNPTAVRTLADLSDPRRVVVLCAVHVPCGRLARAALDSARVVVVPRGIEPDVKGVLTKVSLGEADVGIVYATDARSAANVTDTIPIAGADDPKLEAVYLAAVTTTSRQRPLAQAFIDHLLTATAQRSLLDLGFLPP